MDLLNPIKIKEYRGEPVTIAQVKFDGYYVEVYKFSGKITICTKGQKVNIWPKLQKNQHICKQLESLPQETILRCELHAFDVPATSVPTLINSADERLLLSPFQVELWDGVKPSISFQVQRSYLIQHHGFVVPNIKELSSTPTALTQEAVDNLKELAESSGIEGWVLKDFVGGSSYKLKPQKTVDAFVVGYTISDSDTYAGGLKSVDVAVMNGTEQVVIASVGSGFEGEYRMRVNMKSLIGRVGEFKYQDVGAKGRLKFPRFLRWRDDEKKKSDCKINQLKGV